MCAVFRAVVRACNRYRAPTVAADLTVVRAAQGAVTEFADRPGAASADWGWSALTTGRVDVTTLPCTHHTMLRRPHADAIATAVRERARPAMTHSG
jgi:pyochelin synthetase